MVDHFVPSPSSSPHIITNCVFHHLSNLSPILTRPHTRVELKAIQDHSISLSSILFSLQT